MEDREESQHDQMTSPLLKDALSVLRSVPDPDGEPWNAARQAYLTEARAFASEQRDVTARRDQNGQGGGLGAFLLSLSERRPRTLPAGLIITLSVLCGSALGGVEAAQNSVPGSALYPLKLRVETLRIAQSQDIETRVERMMAVAERRINEAERLLRRGDLIPGKLADRYEEHLLAARQAAGSLTGSERSRVESRLAELLHKHADRLRSLQSGLDEESGSLAAMLDAIRDVGSQLDDLDLTLDDGGDGDVDTDASRDDDEDDDDGPDDGDDDDDEIDDNLDDDGDSDGGGNDDGPDDDGDNHDDDSDDDSADDDGDDDDD